MKKLFVLVGVLLCILPSTIAYYADMRVDVSSDGFVSISGVTNHPSLLVDNSAEFTSKKGEFWLLNVSAQGVFDNVVYEVYLPNGASVNYLKAPDFGRIRQEGGAIIVSGAASNVPLELLIQYTIQPTYSRFPWTALLMSLLGLLIVGFIVKYILKQKQSSSIDYARYSSRQAQILKLLEKNGGELTQSKLEKLTGLPKSSLSRNIDSLVRKEIVEKFNKGMTNSIRIKK